MSLTEWLLCQVNVPILHLTRDIPSLVTQAGFAVQQIEAGYVAAFPKSWAHCCRGSAIRESA